MASAESQIAPVRLGSLDAFRGFVMLAMASGGLGLMQVTRNITQGSGEEIPLDMLARQVDHVAWRGCVFWDLIQPSFMFIVGVAMPFSFAARTARGESWWRQFGHALWRSAVLVALGVFLASNGEKETRFIFTNVLAQIGLGYWFVFLLLGRSLKWQAAAAAAILVGYWALFATYPLPAANVQASEYGLPGGWNWQGGFARHWEKNLNVAADFDRWFLNLFPRSEPFKFNEGGYQTLNFVPSMVTILFGVMAGQWLRSAHDARTKVLGLVIAGACCLMAGTLLDPAAASTPELQQVTWVLCPVVKRIWTPSWTIQSAAWSLWSLAFFYLVIDVGNWRKWAFPLTVVGMNSIAMYLMSQMMKPWLRKQISTHFGTLLDGLNRRFGLPSFADTFGGTYGPLFQSLAVLAALWLICLWLYRRRIFLRI